MDQPFANRRDAGVELAAKLRPYAGRNDVVVLALPRGGVPVAFEVAEALGAPLDIFLVRKLGLPGHPELAMGAIASGGVRVLNDDVVEYYQVGEATMEAGARAEQSELGRREAAYRDGRRPVDVRNRTVLLVDDGLATGSSMKAAVQAVRGQAPACVVVALPVGAAQNRQQLAKLADEVVCARTPTPFSAVGEWYRDFAQTTD